MLDRLARERAERALRVRLDDPGLAARERLDLEDLRPQRVRLARDARRAELRAAANASSYGSRNTRPRRRKEDTGGARADEGAGGLVGTPPASIRQADRHVDRVGVGVGPGREHSGQPREEARVTRRRPRRARPPASRPSPRRRRRRSRGDRLEPKRRVARKHLEVAIGREQRRLAADRRYSDQTVGENAHRVAAAAAGAVEGAPLPRSLRGPRVEARAAPRGVLATRGSPTRLERPRAARRRSSLSPLGRRVREAAARACVRLLSGCRGRARSTLTNLRRPQLAHAIAAQLFEIAFPAHPLQVEDVDRLVLAYQPA